MKYEGNYSQINLKVQWPWRKCSSKKKMFKTFSNKSIFTKSCIIHAKYMDNANLIHYCLSHKVQQKTKLNQEWCYIIWWQSWRHKWFGIFFFDTLWDFVTYFLSYLIENDTFNWTFHRIITKIHLIKEWYCFETSLRKFYVQFHTPKPVTYKVLNLSQN